MNVLDGIQLAQTSTFKEMKDLNKSIDKELSQFVSVDEFKYQMEEIKVNLDNRIKIVEEKNLNFLDQ